ncbi:unnamed protein product [Scytosiphon promiscuus]
MVLRRAASTAACLLVHRTGAFAPPCVHLPVQASGWRRQGTSQRQQQQQKQLHVESVKASPVAMASSARSDTVFAFDFDGVICNSQGESSRSGFRALARLWPEVVAQLRAKHGGQKGDDVPSWIVEKMGELRPIVETGYENILLVRLLIEERLGLEIPYPSEKLVELWGAEARDDLARRYGLSQKELVDAFGSARDDWIETDFKGWLGANTFYEGVPEAITACEGEVYVVTTKQTRFASALLEHAGIQVPVDRIFGLGTGPKAGVLGELKTKYSGSKLVFLEDRVETLELVCADSELEVRRHKIALRFASGLLFQLARRLPFFLHVLSLMCVRTELFTERQAKKQMHADARGYSVLRKFLNTYFHACSFLCGGVACHPGWLPLTPPATRHLSSSTSSRQYSTLDQCRGRLNVGSFTLS